MGQQGKPTLEIQRWNTGGLRSVLILVRSFNSQNLFQSRVSDPVSEYIELCVSPVSGNVYMQESKAPGSGRTSKT